MGKHTPIYYVKKRAMRVHWLDCCNCNVISQTWFWHEVDLLEAITIGGVAVSSVTVFTDLVTLAASVCITTAVSSVVTSVCVATKIRNRMRLWNREYETWKCTDNKTLFLAVRELQILFTFVPLSSNTILICCKPANSDIIPIPDLLCMNFHEYCNRPSHRYAWLYSTYTYTTVSQRMYIVKNFVYLSSKPLSNMLFKSFIVSLISYCLPILYTSIHASDKKCIRKVFKDAIKLGIEHPGIDALMTEQTKTLAMRYIHDEDHFINDFLEKCPSGRYRTIKYRGA